MSRSKPNILITGTPGTGKTTLAGLIAKECDFNYINVGEWVKEKSLHSGRNDEFDCYLLDEDKVCDAMEDVMAEGGNIVDHHTCDFFPERWFDLIIVLQTNNTQLYDRLMERKYNQKKVTENVECEIMMVVLEEAKECYKEEIVRTLTSDSFEDLENNVQQVVSWIQSIEL